MKAADERGHFSLVVGIGEKTNGRGEKRVRKNKCSVSDVGSHRQAAYLCANAAIPPANFGDDDSQSAETGTQGITAVAEGLCGTCDEEGGVFICTCACVFSFRCVETGGRSQSSSVERCFFLAGVVGLLKFLPTPTTVAFSSERGAILFVR